MAAHSRGSVKVWVHSSGGVRRNRDGGAFLAFGEDLEQQHGAAPVQLEVAQLVRQSRPTRP